MRSNANNPGQPQNEAVELGIPPELFESWKYVRFDFLFSFHMIVFVGIKLLNLWVSSSSVKWEMEAMRLFYQGRERTS